MSAQSQQQTTWSVGRIQAAYRDILGQVADACERASRSAEDVTVVAVSKAQPLSAIAAAMEVGCLDFGENRVQEWRTKAAALPRRVRWHFIGPLQRNKVKYLVDDVSLIHSIDDERLIEMLERRANAAHDVLLEVNIGSEPQKAGLPPDAVWPLLQRCVESPVAQPVGLMCIPPHAENPEDVRPYYRRMRALFGEVRERLAAEDEFLAEGFCHLSMGMSGDFDVAISEGATLIRVGTGIFGPRQPRVSIG